MRRALRRAAEIVATRGGATAAARHLSRHHVAVLAYHNVVLPGDAGRGDSSLHLPLPAFLEQIERVARTHEIVDLRTAALTSSHARPRAIITFDDAYRGAIDLALPELRRRGLPAVVFAAPALLGAVSTWWDEMAEQGLLTEERRQEDLDVRGGIALNVRREAFAHQDPPALPASYGIATLNELMSAVGGDISIGSHTWAHEHLPSLEGADLTGTLQRSLDWVRSLEAPTCLWLALPYGAGSVEIGTLARRLGYEGVLRIAGGIWRTASASPLVPRINVPSGMTAEGLELRTSGLLRRR